MAQNYKKIWTGVTVVPKTATTSSLLGELETLTSTSKIYFHNGTTNSPIVTEAHAAVITNKSIDANTNTISNLDTVNLEAGVLNTDLTVPTPTNLQIPSALAVTNYVAATSAPVGTVNALVTLSGVPSGSTDLGTFTGTTIPDGATDKSALQALETGLEAHVNQATGAHAATAISVTPTGNLGSTQVQSALVELQTDIDAIIAGGAGNVMGPASSTDNAIARFDGVTGKLIQNSLVSISDTGAATGLTGLTSSGTVALTGSTTLGTSLQETVSSDAVTTGTNATLTSPATTFLRLTNPSLVSIDTILAPVDGRVLTIENATGNAITINNNTGATTANRILTGTKATLTIADEASIVVKYDATEGRWMVIGGSGAAAPSTGGTTDVDSLFVQTFETAVLGDFTQTGLVLDATSQVHGNASARLNHQTAINQSFKQTVAVDPKFRGKAMTLILSAKSTASNGNLTILFRDETNNIALQSSQVIAATSDIRTFQYGLTIPANSSSISYTITALPETGAISYIDDIAVRNYWTGTSVQGQTQLTYQVPSLTEWQPYNPTFTGFGTVTGVEAYFRQVGSNYEIRGKFTSGTSTAVEARISLPSGLLASTATLNSIEAVGFGGSSSATTTPYNILIEPGVGYMTIGRAGSPSTIAKSNGSVVAGAGEIFPFFASVPMLGLNATTPQTVVTTDLVPAKAMNGSASISVPVVSEWTSYTPTFTGFGTVTAPNFRYRQVGSSVEIEGKFTAGTPTGVEARFTLPNGYTSSSIYNVLESAGQVIQNGNTATSFYATIEPSVNYATFSLQNVGTQALSKANGNNVVSVGGSVSLQAKIQVQGLTANATTTFSSTQNLVTATPDSMIRVNTANGYGSSTGNRTRRFASILESIGSDVLYTDSATDGGTFQVLSDGTYSLSYYDNPNGVGAAFGLTKNASGSANITSLPAANILEMAVTASNGGFINAVNWTGFLKAGDVIRAQLDGGVAAATNGFVGFTISKQGSLKQINTSSDQKITIPTSELRFEGASSRGSTATAIVKFDTIAKLRGDAFTIVNDSVNGTAITMTKSGKLDVSATLLQTGSTIAITKNQSNLTTFVSVSSEIMASSGDADTQVAQNSSASFFVNVGDIIRVSANAAATAAASNILNLSFQEQEIQVSVSNTLPQFSESDSCTRVDGASGYGLIGNKVRRFSNVRQNTGTDVTFRSDTVQGDSFLAVTAGIYNISYSDNFTGAAFLGISRNASSLSTAVDQLAASELLALSTVNTSGYSETVSWQGYLAAGDVIRAQTDGSASSTTKTLFTMSKVGKPNVTGVNVTPFVNVPQPTSQSLNTNLTSTMTAGTLIAASGSGLFTTSTVGGRFRITALKTVQLSAEGTYVAASTAPTGAQAAWYRNGVQTNDSYNLIPTGGGNAQSTSVSFFGTLTAGEYAEYVGSTYSAGTFSASYLNATATALADQILTTPETFSTDSAPLVYAPASSYTLATLTNAPVGTFITYTYAANTNTRTQTSTAPTQTTADMASNGLFITPRAYNVTSTAATPAIVAVQIGKGLKGTSLNVYKATGKTTSGSYDNYLISSDTVEFGTRYSYDEKTGIYVIDAGICSNSPVVSRLFTFNDASAQASAYLTINASKNPALTGITLNRVAARAVNTAGQSIGSATTVVMTYDTSKTFDTHNALNTGTGVFTAPESGYYKVDAIASIAQTAAVTHAISIYKNGALYTINTTFSSTFTSNYGFSVSDVVFLAKNETVDIRVFQTSGTAKPLVASPGYNSFAIAKIGNA